MERIKPQQPLKTVVELREGYSYGNLRAGATKEDKEDMLKGAIHIPLEVTNERQKAHRVDFIQDGGPAGWYWFFPRKDELIPYIDFGSAAEIHGDTDWSELLSLSWSPMQRKALRRIRQRGDCQLVRPDLNSMNYDISEFAYLMNQTLESTHSNYRFSGGYKALNHGPCKLYKFRPDDLTWITFASIPA